MLISSSSRYSIYKVQTLAFAFALACLYYHNRAALSRTFFKFFQSFSEVLVFCVARSNFAMLAHPAPFVKHFFQVFPNFITGCSLSAAPCGQLAYTSTRIPFCQVLFSTFFKKCGVPFGTPHKPSYIFTSRHRSDRSRRPSADKQRRRIRRYLHPGRRRNHAPADSSGESPLPGSWV